LAICYFKSSFHEEKNNNIYNKHRQKDYYKRPKVDTYQNTDNTRKQEQPKSFYSYAPHDTIYTSYETLLLMPEWKAKRQQILNRDGNRCRYCGSAMNLQVHHKYYMQYPDGSRMLPWNYPDDALITLCDSCHKKVHANYQIKTYYTKFK